MRELKCNWLLLAIALGLPGGNAVAQRIDFQFQVYKLDAIVADALQTRLIDGGDPAVQAVAKMPDFVKQKKASLEAELNFQANSGQRVNKVSSKRMLEGNKRFREVDEVWEVVDGLVVEMEASLDPGRRIVDINMYAKFARSSDRTPEGIKERLLTSKFSMTTGVPFLLSRWQEGEDVLLFVGTATSSPQATAATNPPKAQQTVYLDVAFYQSAADAKAKRDQVGRITVPSRVGTKAKSEIFVVYIYDTANAMDSRNLGFKVESDSKPDQSGAIDLTLVLEHAQKTRKRDRLPDGTRTLKLEIREARPVLQMRDGETKTVNAGISSLGNPMAKPGAWVMRVDTSIRAVR